MKKSKSKNSIKAQIEFWENVVDKIVADYNCLNRACDAALKAGAMDSNGPLHEAIWRGFEGILKHLDTHGWINWYIYENGQGSKERKASSSTKKKVKPVKNSRDLAKLIVESQNYEL
jgi:hypothetical protein